jgi:hypothetical protein
MRSDMYKVIVERPRQWKGGYEDAVQRRDDLDGPMHLSMRAGYAGRFLNENLAPLRRYLRSQVGRPWNKVFSEISAGIDRRNTVQQHIYQHIDGFIAIDVGVRDGQLVDLRSAGAFANSFGALRQELYVDPRTGLIRVNKEYRSRHRQIVELPASREKRYDVVFRQMLSRYQQSGERERVYGSCGLYAVSKRQLSKRELKAHGLRE